MNENLSPFAKRLLFAIHDSGAEPGKAFTSTTTALGAAAGAGSVDLETFKMAIRSLVANGVSKQKDGQLYVGSYLASAEVSNDGKVVLVIGAPRSFISAS